MKKDDITSIINYCTNDYRYLSICINEVRCFSKQVLVNVCDHFFNGMPENREMLHRSYAEHLDCKFIEYKYDPNKVYGSYKTIDPKHVDWTHYWHSTGRYVSYPFATGEYLLFLDVDEIVDGHRFKTWLDSGEYHKYDALRMLSYFYFRSASNRSQSTHPLSLLLKKSAIEHEHLLNVFERYGVFMDLEGRKLQNTAGLNSTPLVHHYSWVRTEDELLNKVRLWGHKKDRDWISEIKSEFSQPFSGKDGLFNLRYDQVDPLHDPFKVDVKRLQEMQLYRDKKGFVNVTNVTGDEMRRQSIASIFGC